MGDGLGSLGEMSNATAWMQLLLMVILKHELLITL